MNNYKYKLEKYTHKYNQTQKEIYNQKKEYYRNQLAVMYGGLESDIRVKLENGQWVPARDYQKAAFLAFNNESNNDREYKYSDYNNDIHFSIKNDIFDITYLVRNDSKIPIVDWNDVKVFLINSKPIDWYDAQKYQTWAYFDFLYSHEEYKYYCSKNSKDLNPNIKYTTILFDNIEPNIVFSISRNENGVIFYENNCADGQRVRISNRESARKLYKYHVGRVTTNKNDQTNTYTTTKIGRFELPNVPIRKTIIDNEMCINCMDNEKNIQFQCGHTDLCSHCTIKLIKTNYHTATPFICPVCKVGVMKIAPYIVPSKDKN